MINRTVLEPFDKFAGFVLEWDTRTNTIMVPVHSTTGFVYWFLWFRHRKEHWRWFDGLSFFGPMSGRMLARHTPGMHPGRSVSCSLLALRWDASSVMNLVDGWPLTLTQLRETNGREEGRTPNGHIKDLLSKSGKIGFSLIVASLSPNSCSPRTLKFQVHILSLIEQIAVGNCVIVLTEESDPKEFESLTAVSCPSPLFYATLERAVIMDD